MKKKNGFGKLLLGLGAGVGLGMLFAPEKGSETRKALKLKFNELLEKVKDLDIEDVKIDITERVEEIKEELKSLDKEKVLKIAKEQSAKIKNEIDELLLVAKEKATPVVEKTVEELRESAIKVTKEVLARLEEKPAK